MDSPSPEGNLAVATQAGIDDCFRRLAAEWKEQSRYLSNTAQMAMLGPYQRIIGMGPPVVPLILEELRREPDQWFWALEAITEANPVPPEDAGKVRAMARAWVEWGERQGYRPQSSRGRASPGPEAITVSPNPRAILDRSRGQIHQGEGLSHEEFWSEVESLEPPRS
jgi:hypothetical protein